MGLHTQNGLTGNNLSPVDMRRASVDSIDDIVRDDRKSIDFGRDSVIDQSDIAEILRRRKEDISCGARVRKRLNILLHTHIALITVCVLSSMDAVCVIGQIICDILIMQDKLSKYDDLHDRAIPLMVGLIPGLNDTIHGDYSFQKLVEYLEQQHPGLTQLDLGSNPGPAGHIARTLLSWMDQFPDGLGELHHRARRAAGGEEGEHDLLHELTHSFHIGSMVILSVLLFETMLKIFAMWKHFLDHKLEMFDAFVITVSWSLDVAFWEGIWARPGQEGATLLIFILPWRVIRIVNSFVLVIQEKDLVLLKVVKQRLRISLRAEKLYRTKLDKYRLEVKNLQGLCRKCGADENTIQACAPARRGRRRRSSLFQSLTSLASVALVSAMGSTPKVETDDSDIEVDIIEPMSITVRNGVVGPVSPAEESGISLDFRSSPDDVEKTGSDVSGGSGGSGGDGDGGGEINQAFRYDEETIAKYGVKRGESTKL